jgi:hypothetical protein
MQKNDIPVKPINYWQEETYLIPLKWFCIDYTALFIEEM